jgi:molecular chaperone Hsp33
MVSWVTPKGYSPAPPADFVLPFDLANAGLRGRLVRLDAVATRALSAHPLAEPGQRVLAEALVLGALLGSALKLEGRLSVQTKGDGPLSLVVADYFAGGGLRGYAKLDEAGLPANPDFGALAGKGALAITIEAKADAPAYQGLVPLAPEGLATSAEGYFARSEQLPTMLKLAAGPIFRTGEGSGWRAGGLMIQAVPGKIAGDPRTSDDWQRIALFLQTLEPVELLDTGVSAESVLWRLFHEDEVRVHSARPLSFRCTCSADNVLPVLRSYAPEELSGIADPDGIIRARCEFCGTTYEFPVAELQKERQAKSDE